MGRKRRIVLGLVIAAGAALAIGVALASVGSTASGPSKVSAAAGTSDGVTVTEVPADQAHCGPLAPDPQAPDESPQHCFNVTLAPGLSASDPKVAAIVQQKECQKLSSTEAAQSPACTESTPVAPPTPPPPNGSP